MPRSAKDQYGVVARRQLLALGVGNRAIGDRVRAHHKERHAAAWDREKTNRPQLAGYEVPRFMYGDLVRRPDAAVRTIRAALAG